MLEILNSCFPGSSADYFVSPHSLEKSRAPATNGHLKIKSFPPCPGTFSPSNQERKFIN